MVSRILEAAVQFFFAAAIFGLLYKYAEWRSRGDAYLKERLDEKVANTGDEDHIAELEMDYEMEIDGRDEDGCVPVGCGCGLVIMFIIGGIAALLGHFSPIHDWLIEMQNEPFYY